MFDTSKPTLETKLTGKDIVSLVYSKTLTFYVPCPLDNLS